MYELARRLDRDRFDVRVAALAGGEVADWLREADIPVTVLSGGRAPWALKLPALAALFRRPRVDLLHTHGLAADMAGRLAASFAAVPHVVHTAQVGGGRLAPWQFGFARVMGVRCDRLICPSRRVRNEHSRHSGLPAWRYAAVSPGLAPSAFEPDMSQRDRLRAEWGVPDDTPLSIYVGRLHKRKGIDILLAAMSHLAARGNPHALVIAGDGPERPMVETFIAHGEGGRHCRWIGFQRDLRGVLAAADMAIVPSRWESWPLELAEAMAAGLPVIATRVAGAMELIRDDETGGLVEPRDVVGLAEAVEALGADEARRRRLGQAGRERVLARPSLADGVAAHESLYLEVAGEVLRVRLDRAARRRRRRRRRVAFRFSPRRPSLSMERIE